MEKNILSELTNILSSAEQSKKTAREVSDQLTSIAADLRKVSDSLVLLSRLLVGNTSSEPVGKKTVILKTDEEASAYKKSKSKDKPKSSRRGYSGWTPERRAAQAERARKMQADLKEARNKRALLNTAAITTEQ